MNKQRSNGFGDLIMERKGGSGLKKVTGITLLLLPLVFAVVAVGYWITIWSPSRTMEIMKPLTLRLLVSNGTVTSVDGGVNLTIATGGRLSINLTIKYPTPWERVHQVSPYYYYYYTYQSTYYGRWYPTSYYYRYNYYYSFQAPSTLRFRYIVVLEGVSDGVKGELINITSNTITLGMGSSRTISLIVNLDESGLYKVSAYAWIDYIKSAGRGWGSLADPKHCFVEVR